MSDYPYVPEQRLSPPDPRPFYCAACGKYTEGGFGSECEACERGLCDACPIECPLCGSVFCPNCFMVHEAQHKLIALTCIRAKCPHRMGWPAFEETLKYVRYDSGACSACDHGAEHPAKRLHLLRECVHQCTLEAHYAD